MPRKNSFQLQDGSLIDAVERPSRSQKKRDSLALQKIGCELASLSAAVTDLMPISDDLRRALAELRAMEGLDGSRRRQIQYIGRLMREEPDPDGIRECLDRLKQGLPLRP